MSEIEGILAEHSIKELIRYYNERANETLDKDEYKRCKATAFYLKAYNQLPFRDYD